MTPRPCTHTKTPFWKGFLRSFVQWLIIGALLSWSLAALLLVAARWIDPPTTAVHIQRRLQAWIHHTPYRKRYKFIPLSQISPDFQHAVISSEKSRLPLPGQAYAALGKIQFTRNVKKRRKQCEFGDFVGIDELWNRVNRNRSLFVSSRGFATSGREWSSERPASGSGDEL